MRLTSPDDPDMLRGYISTATATGPRSGGSERGFRTGGPLTELGSCALFSGAF